MGIHKQASFLFVHTLSIFLFLEFIQFLLVFMNHNTFEVGVRNKNRVSVEFDNCSNVWSLSLKDSTSKPVSILQNSTSTFPCYFEVKIADIKVNSNFYFTIGLAQKLPDNNSILGWNQNEVGFGLWKSNKSTHYNFQSDDVVGIGRTINHVFLTKNNELVDYYEYKNALVNNLCITLTDQSRVDVPVMSDNDKARNLRCFTNKIQAIENQKKIEREKILKEREDIKKSLIPEKIMVEKFCLVCLDEEKLPEICFLKCGHVCVCESCWKVGRFKRCIKCRADVQDILTKDEINK